MAIPSSVVVNDGATTPVAQTFEVLKVLPNGIDRVRNGSTLAEPIVLSVRHSVTPGKNGSPATDRHSARVAMTQLDADEKEFQSYFDCVFVVPRTAEFTDQNLKDMMAQCTNFVLAYRADLLLGKS